MSLYTCLQCEDAPEFVFEVDYTPGQRATWDDPAFDPTAEVCNATDDGKCPKCGNPAPTEDELLDEIREHEYDAAIDAAERADDSRRDR